MIMLPFAVCYLTIGAALGVDAHLKGLPDLAIQQLMLFPSTETQLGALRLFIFLGFVLLWLPGLVAAALLAGDE